MSRLPSLFRLATDPISSSRSTRGIGGLSEGPDPEHPGSAGHYRLVLVKHFRLDARLANGDRIQTRSSLHAFHLVRGDVAVLVAGQPADPARWYIRRWLGDTSALTAALAEEKGDCGPVPGDSAAPTATASPGALSILPLGNPACPTLDVLCQLPGTEPARLEVFDVAGRRRNHLAVPIVAPGPHRLQAGAGARLPPGVYWVRLSQGQRAPSTKMVVVAR